MNASKCVGAIVGLSLFAVGAYGARANAVGGPRFVGAGGPWYVGPMAGAPVLGDMNGDAKLDLVVACGTCCGLKPDPASGHLFVLLGDGKGGFAKAEGSPLKVGPSVRKVALGDVNEDGKLDVVAAEHDTLLAHVYLGDGSGKLRGAPGSPFATASDVRAHTHALALGDLDADRHLDVLTTNSNGDSISVLRGDGKGSFAAAAGSPFPAGRHPYDSIALADLDGDGALDVVVPNTGENRISVLHGDGRATLKPVEGSPFGAGPRPGYAIVVDLDGKAGHDIVATHDDDALLAVLVSDGRGGYFQGKGGTLELPERAWGLASGDLNNDGKSDLVLGTHGSKGPLILFGDGAGGFHGEHRVEKPSGRAPSYVALADLNGDQWLDIVTSNFESGDVSVYLNESCR